MRDRPQSNIKMDLANKNVHVNNDKRLTLNLSMAERSID